MTRIAKGAAAQGVTVGLGRAWSMILILSALSIVSFLDRFALGLLVQPLKQDLGVSDVQIGLLFGSAFALFYGAITLPLARLADRGNRVRLIVVAAVCWSACTILSGFATSFLMLVLLRVGLAVGEAALTPSTFSLIGDLLPPNRRTFGGTVYNGLGMAGASGAYIIGSATIGLVYWIQKDGYFVDLRVWQAVFIITGLPGLLLAAILVTVGREPARVAAAVHVEAASFRDVLRYVKTQGWLYAGLFLGAGFIQLGTNAFLAWAPTYLSRAYGMPIVDAGLTYGLYNLIAFVTGSLVVPLVGVWVGRYRRDGVVLIGAVCAVLHLVFCVAAVLQSSPSAFLFFTFIGMMLSVGGASNVLVSIHMFTPPRMRATLTAAITICLTTITLGLGPPLAAALSDRFGSGPDALGVGMGLVAALGGSIAILLFCAARKRVLLYLAMSEGRPAVEASS
ncbi:MAG TPA: MFS transporter [Allosphingosinicella sp.]|nr:MFS transporter [Allosphingosinicella sp.]